MIALSRDFFLSNLKLNFVHFLYNLHIYFWYHPSLQPLPFPSPPPMVHINYHPSFFPIFHLFKSGFGYVYNNVCMGWEYGGACIIPSFLFDQRSTNHILNNCTELVHKDIVRVLWNIDSLTLFLCCGRLNKT